METSVYLAFLMGVDRNSATFALYTVYAGGAREGYERRIADLADVKKTNCALERLDIAANVINCWKDFYAWLGRGKGWAGFDKETGNRLVPHWVGEAIQYECGKSPVVQDAFIDLNCNFDLATLGALKIDGVSPEKEAWKDIVRFESNFVITTKPMFIIN